MKVYQAGFDAMVLQIMKDFLSEAEEVDGGSWQSIDIKGDRRKVTWELREASLVIRMPDSIDGAQQDFQPNLPWAEDHFLERTSGSPLNPPPSQAWWPFAQNGNGEFKKDRQFSHTYPERMWPKHAGHDRSNCPHQAEMEDDSQEGYYSDHWSCHYGARRGIRFGYGDLADVICRLVRNPLTRQAYLPIWFPEDTGAPDGERVPCTLGYHFMVRGGKMHITYHIRSCDFMRHFRDDVYMAVRLAQYVNSFVSISKLGSGTTMGELTMHIGSFHIFNADRPIVKHRLAEAMRRSNEELLRKLG